MSVLSTEIIYSDLRKKVKKLMVPMARSINPAYLQNFG